MSLVLGSRAPVLFDSVKFSLLFGTRALGGYSSAIENNDWADLLFGSNEAGGSGKLGCSESQGKASLWTWAVF